MRLKFNSIICAALIVVSATVVQPIRVASQEIEDPEVSAVVDVAINLLNDARRVLLKAKRATDKANLSISNAKSSRSSLIGREIELDEERGAKLREYNEAAAKSDSAKYLSSVLATLESIYERTLVQFGYIAGASCLSIQGFEGICIPVPWQLRREVLRELARINGRIAIYGENVSSSSEEVLRDLGASLHVDLSALPFGLARYKATTTKLLESYRNGLNKSAALLGDSSSVNAPCGSLVSVPSFDADIVFILRIVTLNSEYDWSGELTPVLERYLNEARLWTTCRAERARVLDAVNDKLRLARTKKDTIREEEADRERLSLVGEIWGLDRDIAVLDLRQEVLKAVRDSLSTLPVDASKVAGISYLQSIHEGLVNAYLVTSQNADAINKVVNIVAGLDDIREESRLVALSKLTTLRADTTLRYSSESRFLGSSFFADMGDAINISLNETVWSSERFRQLLTKALGRLGQERSSIASISSLDAASEEARAALSQAGDAYRIQLGRRLAIDDEISKVITLRNKVSKLLTRPKIQEVYRTVLRDFVQRLSIYPAYPSLQPELDRNLTFLVRMFGSGVKIPNVQSISPRTRIVRQSLLARRRIARGMTRKVNEISLRLVGSQMTDLIQALNAEREILERSFPLL